MIVVDKVAEDAAIRESHSEVLHLNRRTTHFRDRFLKGRLLKTLKNKFRAQIKLICCNKNAEGPLQKFVDNNCNFNYFLKLAQVYLCFCMQRHAF